MKESATNFDGSFHCKPGLGHLAFVKSTHCPCHDYMRDERLRGGGLHSQWPQFYESEPRFGPRRRTCSCGNDGSHLAWSGKRSHGVWSQFTPTACWAWCWGNLWWFFNDRIQVQRIDLITNTTREVWTKYVQNCYATYLPRSWSSARRLAYQITYYGHLGAIMGVGCDGMP